MLTPQREAEIRARREGLTQGELVRRNWNGRPSVWITLPSGACCKLAAVENPHQSMFKDGNRENVEFFVHAPADIDALLAEIDRLRQEVEDYKNALSPCLVEVMGRFDSN